MVCRTAGIVEGLPDHAQAGLHGGRGLDVEDVIGMGDGAHPEPQRQSEQLDKNNSNALAYTLPTFLRKSG